MANFEFLSEGWPQAGSDSGSHCQGVGAGRPAWSFGEGAEMETWQPGPASLAAGPHSRLLESGARGLGGLGQVGMGTGGGRDGTGWCPAFPTSHRQKTPSEQPQAAQG